MEWLTNLDPKILTGLGVIGGIVISFIGYLFLRSSIKEASLNEAELKQGKSDTKRNREANEKYREDIKSAIDVLPDRIDPSDPWAGL